MTDAVFRDEITNGIAIVRPPGHHAECTHAMGFCVFNNVSVAARYLQMEMGCNRILIVDWDIHHGNGTQNEFYKEDGVLYLSIHRFEKAGFYPFFPSAGMEYIGVDAGLGYNINVPWPCGGMGDADYLYVFEKIVMPIARQYKPEMVIVSAGFDAALGDELGECNVTPSGFAEMTKLLMDLNNGKIALALEGGYCIPALVESITACTRVLLGQTVEAPNVSLGPHYECISTVDNVIRVLSPYWSCFEGHVFSAQDDQDDEIDSQDDQPYDEIEMARHHIRISQRFNLQQISGPKNENPIYHSRDYHSYTGSLWVLVHDVPLQVYDKEGPVEALLSHILESRKEMIIEVYLKHDLDSVGQLYDKLLRYSKSQQLNVVLMGMSPITISSLIDTIFEAKWWKDIRMYLTVVSSTQVFKTLDKSQAAWWNSHCLLWTPSANQKLNKDSELGTSSAEAATDVWQLVYKATGTMLEFFEDIEKRRTARFEEIGAVDAVV